MRHAVTASGGRGAVVQLPSLLLAAVLLLVACGSGTEQGGVGRGSSSPPASPAGTGLLPRERLQAEIPIGGEPDWMAVGYGSLWVARDEAAAIDRIDPATNQVAATVAMGGHPCNGATAGFGAIWVPSCSENGIYRIGARSGRVEAVVQLPVYQSLKGVAPSGGLVAGHGAVWVVTSGRNGRFDVLAQVDPRRNGVVRRIPLGHVGGGVAVDETSVWVTAPEDGVLVQVDPRSGRVAGKIVGLVQPTAVTAGLGAVWVLSGAWSDRPEGDRSVTRVDPRARRIVTRIRVDEVQGTPGSLATGAGFVWARTSTTLLAKIDPASDEVVESYRNDKGNGDLVLGFGSVWLSDFGLGTVRRLRP